MIDGPPSGEQEKRSIGSRRLRIEIVKNVRISDFRKTSLHHLPLLRRIKEVVILSDERKVLDGKEFPKDGLTRQQRV